MKLLILILSCHDDLSKKLINGVKSTWWNLESENIIIKDYYGGHDKNELNNKSIFLTEPDIGQHEMYLKTLSAFEFSLNNIEFDFLLRTNASTFIRPDVIYKILSKETPKDFYGAAYPKYLGRLGFPPGTSMLFSTDVIEKIVKLNRQINNPENFIDDAGIGFLLRKIYPTYLISHKFYNRIEIPDKFPFMLHDPLFKIKYSQEWAFRCKSENNNRDNDIKKMNKLFNIYYDRFY